MTPAEYIEMVLKHLTSVEFIAQTNLIREFSNTQKGHLRVRVTFTDGTFLEFYEYIEPAGVNRIQVVTYAYHWSTVDGKLILRWDNAPHFPNLPNAPHHIHNQADKVVPGQSTNIFVVLDEIERELKTK